MRIRISPENQRLVNEARKKGNLTANAEVNRALAEHYSPKKPELVTTKTLMQLLGSHHGRRFLRAE